MLYEVITLLLQLQQKGELFRHLLQILGKKPAAFGEDAVIRSGHGGGETGGVGVEEPLLHPFLFQAFVEEA